MSKREFANKAGYFDVFENQNGEISIYDSKTGDVISADEIMAEKLCEMIMKVAREIRGK